jgi:hypothetical protein
MASSSPHQGAIPSWHVRAGAAGGAGSVARQRAGMKTAMSQAAKRRREDNIAVAIQLSDSSCMVLTST